MVYAGFWRRLPALIIDVTICFLVVAFFLIAVRESSIPARFLSVSFFGLLVIAYQVVFHAQWGQTIGKMALGIEVTTLSGTAIGYKEATLRSSVDLIFWVFGLALLLYVLFSWTGPPWSSLTLDEATRLIDERNWIRAANQITRIGDHIWLWSEVVVILFNKKRRALHDFIAGTVVIHTA